MIIENPIGKKIRNTVIMLAVIFLIVSGCTDEFMGKETWRPCFVSCETGVYYTEEDGKPKPHYETGYWQYMVDMEVQLYGIERIRIHLPVGANQIALFLDSYGNVTRIEALKGGSSILNPEKNDRYFLISVRDEENESLQLEGETTDTIISGGAKTGFGGKSFSVLGDSISIYPEMIGTLTRLSPYEELSVTDMWWYRLALDMDMDICRINAYGGSGVTNQTLTEGTQELAASMGRSMDLGIGANVPDVIFILTGGNDILCGVDHAAISKGYRRMTDNVQRTYPDAKVYLCTYYHSDMDNVDTEGWLNQEICSIADEYGTELIDLRECGISEDNKEEYLLDGMHPNQNGFQLISDYMTGEMLKR